MADVTKKVDRRKCRKTFRPDPLTHTKYGPRKRPTTIEKIKATSEAKKKAWEKHRATYMEAFKTRQGTRAGVPDGMQRAEAEKVWAEVRAGAKETVKKMIENNIITDDQKANEALETALTIMRGPNQVRDKLSAARTILEWTKAKPAQKQEVTVQKAEDWLALVTADVKQLEGEKVPYADLPELPDMSQ